LEALTPDMKFKRYNKMVATEDIALLQECLFLQHKAGIRKLLDKSKAKQKQKFNELKVRNALK
jgi:hypothetical protein